MFRQMQKNLFNFIVMGLTGAAVITLGVLDIGFSSIYYILIAGALGLVVYLSKYLYDRSKRAKIGETTAETEKTEINEPKTEDDRPIGTVENSEIKDGGKSDDIS